jgi:pimeloyl-ACP methyl ester carboxylesterase
MPTEPRLHIEVDGVGPPIVLGHGFGGSARNFGALARALKPRFRVVRFDARGHARSEAPTDPQAYAPEAFVADVTRVLDHVGAREAVIGGLSMGAGIALRFALAHPDRTRALVLAAFPPGHTAPGSFAAVGREFADAIEREGLEAAGMRYVWGPTTGLDTRAAALIRQGFLEHPPHGVAHTLRGLIAVQPTVAEIRDVLATLVRPALVIVGANDRPSLIASRELADALPDARLAIVPAAGHLVNMAQPAAFNAEVARFLETSVAG